MEIAYLKKYKAIVTGHKGYVGSQFLQLFPKEEIEIKLLEESKNAKIILHLAARVANNHESFLSNVQLDTNLFEFCKENSTKVIYASGNNVYGHQLNCSSQMAYHYNDYYSASKIIGEQLLRQFYHIPHVCLRIGDIFGLNQRHGNFFKAISNCLSNNNPFVLMGHGSKTRSYIYTPDLVGLFLFLIKNEDKINNEIFNVSYEQPMSLAQILEFLSQKTGLAINKMPNLSENQAVSLPDIRTMKFEQPHGFLYQFTMMSALEDFCNKVKRGHSAMLDQLVN